MFELLLCQNVYPYAIVSARQEISLIQHLLGEEPAPPIEIILLKLPLILLGPAPTIPLAMHKLPLIGNFPHLIIINPKPTLLRIKKFPLIDNPAIVLVPDNNFPTNHVTIDIAIIEKFTYAIIHYDCFFGDWVLGASRAA